MRVIPTVLEPAASLALVDLETVRDELGVTSSDPVLDARLTRYIAQASAQIHTYCNRIIPAQIYRNIFRRQFWVSRFGEPIVLSEFPVIEILGISDDDAAIDASAYEANLASGTLWRLFPGGIRMGWGALETVVDFRAGYAEIPADVQAAALRLVRLQNSTRVRDPYLKVREGPTYGREEFWVGNLPLADGGLPQDVAQMIDAYARDPFG